MHEVIAVANDFIARGQREGRRDLNAMKLHALVYLVCCYWLARDDAPQAQVMACGDGVFLRELREHGCWGTRRVAEPISLFLQASPEDPVLKAHTARLPRHHAAAPLLDWVWTTYGKRSPYDLNQLTREPGTPWDRVWNDPARHGGEAREIAHELLQQWFIDAVQRRLTPRRASAVAHIAPSAYADEQSV